MAARELSLMVSDTTMTARMLPSQAIHTGVRPWVSAVSAVCRRSSGAVRDHWSASQLRRPAWAAWPSTIPVTPLPPWPAKSSTAARSAPALAGVLGDRTADRVLRGVLERARDGQHLVEGLALGGVDVAARSCGRWSRCRSCRARSCRPVRVDSRICGPLMRMPSCAPRPVPTSRAVGVASPSAQGQAMIRTATAAVKAAVAEWPVTSHAARVRSDRPMTTGTNTADTRSASRCTSALPFWASSTRRAIWASWVSDPTRLASTTIRPPALTVAPTTLSPGPTSTGTDSPVSIAASMAEVPLTTVPSVATFSPGRTTKRSPTASWETGIRVSIWPRGPSRSTATSFAPMSRSARRAAPEVRLALASKYRPAMMNVVTAAATSR